LLAVFDANTASKLAGYTGIGKQILNAEKRDSHDAVPSRHGGVGEGGDALTLEAEGDEYVAETLDGEGVEKFAGEVDGEGTLEGDELAYQGGPVKCGDQADEFFNLCGL